ncbi:MAG: biotin synthase BioB [Rikenellaceae bacterium]
MNNIVERIIRGERLSAQEALQITRCETIENLGKATSELRTHFHQNHFDSCSIMNARSGKCTEDCKWCSQSKYFATKIETYPLTDSPTAITHALDNHTKGIRRFALVTSGRTMTDRQVREVCKIYNDIRQECSISLCASMGLLNESQLVCLKEAGVSRYHCNIETAPSFFPTLCSTHTQEEKLETIRSAQRLGMSICSGGIIGMGETLEQRVEMAIYIRDIVKADSVPVNVLNPIVGTPLEGQTALSDEELLRSFAMFRLVMPDKHIRFAGGRTLFSHLTETLLRGGVSGAIMGDLLTTIGASVEQDKQMLHRLGLQM